MEKNAFYLGLDIGTDSVGYAVTDDQYQLLKHKGEPLWGVTLFEKAELAKTRREKRTARRRIDRRSSASLCLKSCLRRKSEKSTRISFCVGAKARCFPRIRRPA